MKDNVVYVDTVSKAVIPCGFCSTGSHNSCKGGYRNGNGSVLICGCDCADSKPQFCHHCKTTEPDFLGRPWLCDARDECESRLNVRLAGSPLMRLIKETRPTGISRSRKGCLCCDQPTKGGNFLPGHDSKYLNQWIAKLEAESLPWMDGYKVIAEISPALAEKFKKRVYG